VAVTQKNVAGASGVVNTAPMPKSGAALEATTAHQATCRRPGKRSSASRNSTAEVSTEKTNAGRCTASAVWPSRCVEAAMAKATAGGWS
jgi:hypothetical protein